MELLIFNSVVYKGLNSNQTTEGKLNKKHQKIVKNIQKWISKINRKIFKYFIQESEQVNY